MNFLFKILRRIAFIFNLILIKNQDYLNKTYIYYDLSLYELLNISKFLFNKKPVFFDIGANSGQWIELFNRILDYEYYTVYSFEADKDIFSLLKKTLNSIKNSNFNIYNLALGDKKETKIFYQVPSSVDFGILSSFKKPIDKKIKTIEKKIEVLTGDHFCKSNNISYIDFMKINVQGYETQVLKGFKNMLSQSNIKMIMLEFDYSYRYHDNYENGIADFENFLREFNYKLFDIVHIKKNKLKNFKDRNNFPLYLKLHHGYVIFVNKEILNNKIWDNYD